MTSDNLWKNVLEELKITVSAATFRTFFSQTILVSFENNIITIGCPNAYLREQVELRYYSLIKDILDRQTKQKNSLVFILRSPAQVQTALGPLFEEEKPPEEKVKFDPNTNLNPRYTLKTFVVGNSNNFAHAAALGIIKDPGNAYNPFFIWGGVGVGKTHLLQGIGQEILQNFPSYKILYANAETFTNELVTALRNKTAGSFKKKYRSVDVLLVDDIQFIAGKEYSQEEFFHTFNTLYLAGRQIILTSDRRPEELAGLEERLVSRFRGGLTVDVQPPDYEMRVAIIKQKCQEKEINIGEEAIQLIAKTVESNARDLEGVLFQIIARASGEPVQTELVKNFLGVKNGRKQRRIAPKRIVAAVGRFFNLKRSELVGPSRTAEIALARQVAMYFLKKELEISLLEIAEILGRRDHTTVIHGVDKISRQFSTNANLRKDILAIRERIYS
ncbi:chromosomal replication initiator protein DnaA [Candidatus Shapirobacteria bacterium]|nr:chromosomal replication initiator protein DnaA [Candidatus Shapirobacteria bacterium]